MPSIATLFRTILLITALAVVSGCDSDENGGDNQPNNPAPQNLNNQTLDFVPGDTPQLVDSISFAGSSYTEAQGDEGTFAYSRVSGQQGAATLTLNSDFSGTTDYDLTWNTRQDGSYTTDAGQSGTFTAMPTP